MMDLHLVETIALELLTQGFTLVLVNINLEKRFEVHRIEGGHGKGNRISSVKMLDPQVNGQSL